MTQRPRALVTGASSGIGLSFAQQLERAGHDLVLVARRRERLEDAAAELRDSYDAEVEILPADLADPEAREAIFRKTRGLGVEILINNAGFVLRGPFATLYGNASGGVIQVFTADGPPDPTIGLRADGGSYGTYKFASQYGAQHGPCQ